MGVKIVVDVEINRHVAQAGFSKRRG